MKAYMEHMVRHPKCDCAACADRTHHPTRPHWSTSIAWPADRWDAMESAPSKGYPILHVRGRTADGVVIPDMHFAQDLNGEDQPPFIGWFAPSGTGPRSGFHEVEPVEWQPLDAGAKKPGT